MWPGILLLLAIACSSTDKKTSEASYVGELKSSPLAGSLYTTIIFNKSDSTLSQDDQQRLKGLSHKVNQENKVIEEIKILAWADQEYPDKIARRASSKDVALASERAFIIRDYLEANLQEAEDIDSYNMAKRPGLISQLFKNDEFTIKEIFENSGATASYLADGSVSYSKASKALVIILYEDDKDKFK